MGYSPFKDYYASDLIDKEVLKSPSTSTAGYHKGDFCIVVADRGWVFVGFITPLDNSEVRIDCCYNIHRWGTTEGLGQLCDSGPLEETVLYKVGTVFTKPILLMKANIEKW